MTPLDPEVEDLLLRAGFPTSTAPAATVERWIADMEADGFRVVTGTAEVLRRFGGLRVGTPGPGVDNARSVVEFDPTLAWGEADRFARFGTLLGLDMSPLGEVDGGHALLALGSDGSLYFLMDTIWLAGRSVESGLGALLLGRHCRRLG